MVEHMCIVSVYVGTWGEKNGFYILRGKTATLRYSSINIYLPWDCVFGVGGFFTER